MRTRIKICCLASVEEVRLAVDAGADAVGFVGVQPPSPRTLDDRTIASLIARVPPPVATVLLTAETVAPEIARQVIATGASTVQIVSRLDPAQGERLTQLLPTVRRVQVIHVEGEHVLDMIEPYAPHVNAFLLDSGRPSLDKPEYGGTGRTHDWDLSAEFVRRSPIPVFLAGGLSSENVVQAIETVRPFGVDLCSGVRTTGRLDHGKLLAFVSAVRQADHA